MIKVIAFDFGGVLGPDADDWDKTFKEILKLTGFSKQKMQQVFSLHWPNLKAGKESMKSFWEVVAKASHNKVPPQELRESYNNSIFIDRDALKLIKMLRGKCRVVLLANDSDDDYLVKTKKLKLGKVFDELYCSSNLGVSKSGKEIFEYVLNDLQIKPNELLFIDNQENNILAAKSLGINYSLFEEFNQLQKELSFPSF